MTLKYALKQAYQALPFKQPVFTLLRFLHPPERIYKHLHFKGIIRVNISSRESFRMRHLGYLIENELFWRGLEGWEKVSAALWITLSREARTIIDVGANTGVYTLMARSVNATAKIVSLEPVERIFRMLEDNLRLNGYTVHALQAAASSSDGTAFIYEPPDAHVLSVSLNKDFNTWDPTLRPVPVPTRTLDSIAEERQWPRVDLVKIDTETHEPEVLDGMRMILLRDRPTLLIEILNDTVAQRVEALVNGLGYLYFNIDEVAPPRQVEQLSRSGHYNFLICLPTVAQRLGLKHSIKA
jgi:FkbM family methyltransferase